MSLTSTLITPKAMLDTTVLCGALLTPGGNRKLLTIARAGIYQPVISNVCLLEFIRNASRGLGKKKNKRVFDWTEIDLFMDAYVFPALQGQPVSNSVVSRDSYDVIKQVTHTTTIGEALISITGISDETATAIVQQQEMQIPLHKFDIQDFHVWSTAINTNCDVIVTSNNNKFPSQIGPIKRFYPADYLHWLEEEC